MLVREVMSAEPVTVSSDTSLKHALRTLADRGVTALPVVDAHGLLVGIVSEADVVDDGLEPDPRAHLSRPVTPRGPAQVPTVAAVMSTTVVTVHPDDDLADGLDLLVAHRHKSLPVVDLDGHVVGMLSRSDVVRLLARSDAEVSTAVTQLLRRTIGGDWTVEVHDGVVHLAGSKASLQDAVTGYLLAGTVPGVLGVDEAGGHHGP